jgi:hypothetical protein
MSRYNLRRYSKPQGNRGDCQTETCINHRANRDMRTILNRTLDLSLGNSNVSGHMRSYMKKVYTAVGGKGKQEKNGMPPLLTATKVTYRLKNRGEALRASRLMTCPRCKSMGRSKRAKGKKTKKKGGTLDALLANASKKQRKTTRAYDLHSMYSPSNVYRGLLDKLYTKAKAYQATYASLTAKIRSSSLSTKLRKNYHTNNSYAFQN